METKERIKSRMLKNAAKIWGYKDTELETAYDPLVGLLMGALSVELEKVSDEIETSQARILDRLAQLLTPDVLTSSRPAHAILHARSSEPEMILAKEIQLYTIRKLGSNINNTREQSKEIFFSSALPFKLINGDIRYIANGKSISVFKNTFHKESVTESASGAALDGLNLWIGFETNDRVKTLDGVAIYFDLRNEAEKNSFFQNLVLAKCYLNGKEIDLIPGFPKGKTTDAQSNNLYQEIDITPKVESFVKDFYQQQFLSFNDIDGNLEIENIPKQNYPHDFKGIFSEKDLQKMQDNLIWIKLVFPSSMNTDLLNDVFCSINSFPVINRRLNKFSYRLQENLNIIPLNSDDIFFDMKIVYGSDGTIFQSKPLTNYNKLEGGSYTLRHGGVGRFDSRSASEMVNHLSDLLRDESAAFSIIGNEFLASDIRQLNQIIASLEQKTGKEIKYKETISYLMIRSRGQGENIFIEFWTLNGLLGNNIRAGSRLDVYSGGDLQNDSVILLTASGGGREKLSTTDSLNTYKEAVLSRGRVVTIQDIKAVCYNELGPMITEVEVTKGVMVDSKIKNGIRRVVDVKITAAPKQDIPAEDWARYCKSLEVILHSKSTGMYPFKVKVVE